MSGGSADGWPLEWEDTRELGKGSAMRIFVFVWEGELCDLRGWGFDFEEICTILHILLAAWCRRVYFSNLSDFNFWLPGM